MTKFIGWEIRGMSNLKKLVLNITYDKVNVSSNYFSSLTKLEEILVPIGNVYQYRNNTYLSQFKDIIKPGSYDLKNNVHAYTVTKKPTGTGKENAGEITRVYNASCNSNVTSFTLGGWQSGTFGRWCRSKIR